MIIKPGDLIKVSSWGHRESTEALAYEEYWTRLYGDRKKWHCDLIKNIKGVYNTSLLIRQGMIPE